jgi:hypothetical protein
VLHVTRKYHKSINTFQWIDILKEMKEMASNVLDVLATIAVPKVNGNGSQLPPLCMAILMNTRFKELSLVQKLTSVTLGVGGATEMVGSYCVSHLLVNGFPNRLFPK